MRVIRQGIASALILGLAVAACSSDDGGPEDPARTIAKTPTNSGDGQSETVTSTLPQDLRVLVTAGGQPVEDVQVSWAVSANAGIIAPATATTGSDGIAIAEWTFGTTSGTHTATATLAGATGSPVSFTATATADLPTGFIVQGGDDQTGLVNTVFGDPLTVLMHDQYNNPVAGQNVGWSVITGDADLAGTVSATSAGGVATMTATYGPSAGPIEIEAAPQNGLPPVIFSATSALAPSAIEIAVENNFFSPQQDTVAAGGTVTWTWVGSDHNVTPDAALPPASGNHSAPFTYGPIIFATPGTYTYHCTNHPPGMVGTIVVL